MACAFNPEPLAKFFNDRPRNDFESRTQLTLFRDELIRILRALRVTTITGTISVVGLAIGSSVDFSVDHSADATFCLAESPTIDILNGVDVQIFALIDIDGTGANTTGGRFAGRITNISIGGTSTGTFDLTWSRRGFV